MAATAPPLAPLEDVWKNGTSPPTTKPLPHVQRDVEDRIGYRFKKPELLANVFHAKWQGVLAILGNNLARLLITQYFASAFPENEEHHTNNGMGPMLAHRVAAGFALRLGLDGLLEDDGGIRNDGEYIVKMVMVFHSLLAALYLFLPWARPRLAKTWPVVERGNREHGLRGVGERPGGTEEVEPAHQLAQQRPARDFGAHEPAREEVNVKVSHAGKGALQEARGSKHSSCVQAILY